MCLSGTLGRGLLPATPDPSGVIDGGPEGDHCAAPEPNMVRRGQMHGMMFTGACTYATSASVTANEGTIVSLVKFMC